MFDRLRLRLTLLYLAAALLLIAATGGSSYALLRAYFQQATDRALRQHMAQDFRQLGVPPPAELAAFDIGAAPPAAVRDGHDGDEGGDGDDGEDGRGAARFDPELAAVFALPLTAGGELLPGGAAPPGLPDRQAAAAALAGASDWRTVRAGGAAVRLLTYRLPCGGSPALLQLGRPLADQERVLRRLLLGLLALAGAGGLLLGAGSWWLAGPALRPVRAAWDRQRAFVANAGHELRAPLTLLRASAEVALRRTPAGDAEQRALLGDVLAESDHMARLVEDLLLLSRLDARRLPLERRVVPLGPLLGDLARQVARVADERGVRVRADGGGAVWADPARLRQVLLILLDNGLRHTPPGGCITLCARPEGPRVRLTVGDTGAGIAPEHLPHLFERFYRVERDRARAGGGAGVGLAIAQALVEAQRGTISLESRPGAGTRVTIALPAAAP